MTPDTDDHVGLPDIPPPEIKGGKKTEPREPKIIGGKQQPRGWKPTVIDKRPK